MSRRKQKTDHGRGQPWPLGANGKGEATKKQHGERAEVGAILLPGEPLIVKVELMGSLIAAQEGLGQHCRQFPFGWHRCFPLHWWLEGVITELFRKV